MCPSLDMSPALKSTGYHVGGAVMGGRTGTRLLRLPGRGLHWEPAENRKSLNRTHASHQKTIKLKLRKEMGLHKVSCAKWKSLDFILESYRGLWKDFKHGNGISKKDQYLRTVEPRLGAHNGKEIQLSSEPQEVRAQQFISGVWKGGRQGTKDGEEEELHHRAGPQGLCEDDLQEKCLSQRFSVRKNRAGGLGWGFSAQNADSQAWGSLFGSPEPI